jgi:hypothetical protein
MNANSLPSLERTSAHLARTAAAALALAIVCALLLVFVPPAQAQTFKVIHYFTAVPDGAGPRTGLTFDAAGNLYGTTGGWGGEGEGGGTIFMLKHYGPDWVLTLLQQFVGAGDHGSPGGWAPDGRVAIAPDGTVYGTTYWGGTYKLDDCGHGGCGTVFSLTPYKTNPPTTLVPWYVEAVLWSFGDGSNGAEPQGDLTFDQAGNAYGTTLSGGSLSCEYGYYYCGVVYELTPPGGYWNETVLYSGPDAYNPSGGVVFDKLGNLYGVWTFAWGGIYELARSGSGWTAQIIYSFTDGSDGLYPFGGLIIDASGNLYGTTTWGTSSYGTVFELTPGSGGWTLTTLYSFYRSPLERGNCGPQDKLFMDAAGNLYGTTYCAGAYRYGNVFKLTPSNGGWTYTSLHDFTGGSDGKNPISTLVSDADGNLYGTASAGGRTDGFCQYTACGVVFEITP